MRLLRLEATDFAMHAELDVDLRQLSQVAVIGENGAGKSRLLDAVLWCLFGRPTRGRPDLLIRRGQTSMMVRTTWDRAGQEIVVQRSRETKPAAASSLELYVDGERRTRHTIGETEEEIERLAGLPLRVLWSGPLMPQGESDALMRADPRDRKDVLGRLFGVDEYVAFHGEAKDRYARAAAREHSLLTTTEALHVQVQANAGVELEAAQIAAEADMKREALADLTERVASMREEAVRMEAREQRIATLDAELEALHRRLDRDAFLKGKAAAQLDALAGAEMVAVPEWDGEDDLQRARQAAENRAAAVAQRAGIESRLAMLETAVADTQKMDLCDRCPFRADTIELAALRDKARILDEGLAQWAGVEAKVTALEQEKREVEAAAAAAQAANARFDATEEHRATLVAQIAGLEQQIEHDNGRIRELAGERLRLQQEMTGREALIADLSEYAARLTSLTHEQERLDQAAAVAQAAAAAWREAKERLSNAETELAAAKNDAETLEVVTRMFHRDGIPMMLLDRGLPLVESRANEILGRLPGGIRLSLVTERETKQGGVRETLDVVVDQDGSETVYDVLSGAERFRVDFALRLGVADVLSHRSGSAFETLWLDEPFSAQSPRALETVLECLSAVADDFGLMIVVTHQPDVADRFPARLVVTKEDGIATVAIRT